MKLSGADSGPALGCRARHQKAISGPRVVQGDSSLVVCWKDKVGEFSFWFETEFGYSSWERRRILAVNVNPAASRKPRQKRFQVVRASLGGACGVWAGVNCSAVTFVVALVRVCCSLGLMTPLCCDQPETLTRGYYPGVDSMATTRRLVAESSYSGKRTLQTNKTQNRCRYRRILRTTMGGRNGQLFLNVTYSLVVY